ncbi:unnamed protein product [Arabidopsis halleri]
MSERGKSDFESFLKSISLPVRVKGKSNFESFLKSISLPVRVKFHTEKRVGSSSSRGKAERVKKPHLRLGDIWSAYDEWSNFCVGVPLTLKDSWTKANQYYAPTLSAIQIFTKKPFVDDGSSSSSSSSRSFGEDCHLYFEYNETMSLEAARPPLTMMFEELAKKHHGLNTLRTSDLSENSWFSITWSRGIQIPAVQTLNQYFLTYHSLTPVIPETIPKRTKVELPAFGVLTTKLDKVWIMPGTSDQETINRLEESAASWMGKCMFSHSDFNIFMAEKSKDLPFSSGVVTSEW